MARFPLFLVVGFLVPIALLFANLGAGLGGILATVGLFIWIGLAVFLAPSEEDRA